MRVFIIVINIFFAIPNASKPSAVLTQINNNKDSIFIQDLKRKTKKALFVKHFKILDSVVALHPSDTIYGGGCFQSILFMVKNTKIEVSTDIGGLGRITFSKTDLLNWHDWYKKKYNIEK
jgi:hypothetical protein